MATQTTTPERATRKGHGFEVGDRFRFFDGNAQTGPLGTGYPVRLSIWNGSVYLYALQGGELVRTFSPGHKFWAVDLDEASAA